MNVRRELIFLCAVSIVGCSNSSVPNRQSHCATQACPEVVETGPSLPFVEFSVPTASSAPRGIALGSDMSVWFTEYNASKIGRITTGGAITEYATPTTGSAPQVIAAGKKGVLWFTENKASKIGQITTSGVVTEYPTLTPTAGPIGIAFGPDKNMWFVENRANKIGVITPTGAVTEYTIPTPASAPTGITVGGDGAMWFTESNTNKIGRITTTGTFTEYAITGTARFITSAKDGNLWFTNPANGDLGRITTSGVVTYFPTTATAAPQGITRGPDGNPWTVESGDNAIQYYDTAAAKLSPQFIIPTTASGGAQITNGPDGNIWFTENAAGKIGVYVRLLQQVTPSSIAFTAVGETQGFSIKESHYTGNFTVTGCPTSIVTITPTTPAKAFTAIAQGVGSCQATIADTKGNWSLFSISVTTTQFQDQ